MDDGYGMSVSLVQNTPILNFILQSCFTTGLNSCDSLELGRLCPFSAPRGRGHTFSTCPPKFPPRVFHGQIFIPDKHPGLKVGPLSPSELAIKVID